jgi:hypothetical protein
LNKPLHSFLVARDLQWQAVPLGVGPKLHRSPFIAKLGRYVHNYYNYRNYHQLSQLSQFNKTPLFDWIESMGNLPSAMYWLMGPSLEQVKPGCLGPAGWQTAYLRHGQRSMDLSSS